MRRAAEHVHGSAVQAQDTLNEDGPLGKLHDRREASSASSATARPRSRRRCCRRTCLSCHGEGDSKALAAKTAKVKPLNPHENRHYGTEADCGLCHRQHEKSVNFCLDCHTALTSR
jgi:hypothetical protein